MVAVVRRFSGYYFFAAGGLLAALACVSAGCSRSSLAQKTPDAPKVNLGKVACLSTRWYPETTRQADQIENPLLRELVRQAVLIVAREDLGFVTRDETLGEVFPTAKPAAGAKPANGEASNDNPPPLEVAVDVRSSGKWSASLFGAGATSDHPVWAHEATYKFDRPTVYSQLAAQIAEECPKIAASLRSAGAQGEAKKLNPDNKPGAEIEKRLGEMNFVSQYAAVRAAHQAIAEKGPSIEWLGVLVRGYAHLSMLTDHYWASQNDAFAARSLLYAERMVQLSDDKSLAKWHRAYAWAIIGMDVPVLEELRSLTALESKSDVVKGTGEMPPWTKVVAPYAKFDHQALEKVAAEHAELNELVAWLQWRLYREYYHDRWIWEQGKKTIRVCPEAYEVYSVLANWPSLGIERSGAQWGLAAIGHFLPKRICAVDDLPPEVQEASEEKKDSPASRSDVWKRPMRISKALVTSATEEKTPSEFSWAILGKLIAEEQFSIAADAIHAEQNATEHSQESIIEQLTQVVGDHPYVAYIRSFNERSEDNVAMAKTLGGMKIRDPNSNMRDMFGRGWRVPMLKSMVGGDLAWKALWGADLTYPGRCTSYYHMINQWGYWVKIGSQRKLADSLREMNPNSPQAARLQWEMAEKADPTKYAEYEKQLRDDPIGWRTLGDAYAAAGDDAGAKRCFERSLKISPSYDATRSLADCYYRAGDKKLWRKTLEGYLQSEDLGLNYVQISMDIAVAYVAERNWKKAEAPALKAAESYSGGGLTLASSVYEGTGDWEKSEYYAAECTRNYRTSAGTDWYFWCCRTGRGDKEAARSFAEASVKRAESDPSPAQSQRASTYYLLEGNAAAALRRLDFSRCPTENEWDAVWRIGQSTIAAGKLNDTERRKQSIAEWRGVIEKIKTTDAGSAEILSKVCDAFEGKKLDAGELDKINAGLETWPDNSRSFIQYFLGAALDDQGDKEQAELCWRRSAFRYPLDCFATTLSGDALVKRFGPERGGLPREYADLEAKLAKENDAEKADEAVKGDSKQGVKEGDE